MNEKQNNLNDYLNDLCAFMYGSDKNEMLLDLLVVIGNWSEFELREDREKDDAKIKVGDIITDGKINYLVIDITDKSYVALQGTDFEPSYIGKDYIKSYHNLHDSKDMQKIVEEISKAMKGGAE